MTVFIPNSSYKNTEFLNLLQEISITNQNVQELISNLEQSNLAKTNVFRRGVSIYTFTALFRLLIKQNNQNQYDFGIAEWNKNKANMTFQKFICGLLETRSDARNESFLNHSSTSLSYFSEVFAPVFQLSSIQMDNNTVENNIRRNCLNQTDEYRNLTDLNITDFYKIQSTIGKPKEEFLDCVNELIDQNKINPFYKFINLPTNEFHELLINTNLLSNRFSFANNLNELHSASFKNLMQISLNELQNLADAVVSIYRLATKEMTLLKIDDNFANYNETNRSNNYYNLFSETTGVNYWSQTFYSKSITQFTTDKFRLKPNSQGLESIFLASHQEPHYDAKYCHILDQKINDLPVYSFLPKEFLSQLTLSIIDKKINFQRHMPTDIAYSKVEQKESTISVAPLGDFSFVGDDFEIYLPGKINNKFTMQAPSENAILNPLDLKKEFSKKVYEDVETLKLKDLFANAARFTNNKITALVLNNFCSGSSDNFHFEIKPVTKNQLLTSNNIFVPFAFKTTILNNQDFTEEEVYYVTMVCFQSFQNFRKFTRSQKFIQYLDTLIATNTISNPEKYAEIISAQYGETVKYYLAQKDIFSKLGPSTIKRISERTNQSNISLIDPNRLSILNGKLNIDENLSKELDRLKAIEGKIKEKLNEEEASLIQVQELEMEKLSDLNNYKEYILQTQAKIIEIEKFIQELPQKISNQKEKYNRQKQYFESFNSNYQKTISAYKQKEQEAIRLNNFVSDAFFSNLNSRSIFITKIMLRDEYGNDFELNQSNLSSITNDHYSKQTITNVQFIIAKPIEIKVDGDANNIVYGGPYKVSVTNDSLQVAPLNPSTILAHVGNQNFGIHPHASQNHISKNTTSNEFYSYRRGCLGESSSYIYNAFKCKSTEALKMILVNTFIWLSSANSSDAWGRNYKYFPKKGDPNLVNLDKSCIDLSNLITITQIDEPSEELIEEALMQDNDFDDCDDHDFNDAGFCIHCGYYDEEYDLSLTNEDEENVATTSPVYTPYVQLTNTNNNQG